MPKPNRCDFLDEMAQVKPWCARLSVPAARLERLHTWLYYKAGRITAGPAQVSRANLVPFHSTSLNEGVLV